MSESSLFWLLSAYFMLGEDRPKKKIERELVKSRILDSAIRLASAFLPPRTACLVARLRLLFVVLWVWSFLPITYAYCTV